MPFGSVKAVAFGGWMGRRGGYWRSLGEGTPPAAAGATVAPRPRPAVDGAVGAPEAWVPPRPPEGAAGFSILGAPDPEMPPSCAHAAAAMRRMPSNVFIASLRSCAAAVSAAAQHQTGREARSAPWYGRWPRSSGWRRAAHPLLSPDPDRPGH